MMLLNSIKIAFMSFWHCKLYSSVNVMGLALPITCVLPAVWYGKHERSYGHFHKKDNLLLCVFRQSKLRLQIPFSQ